MISYIYCWNFVFSAFWWESKRWIELLLLIIIFIINIWRVEEVLMSKTILWRSNFCICYI